VSRDHVRAIWADDFHHQLRVTLTGEHGGYYAAYTPGVHDLARTITHGWLYEGQMYGPKKESRGTSASALEAGNFVYCIENHDQIGNRAHGDRLTQSVSMEAFRAATLLLLALPMTPLLFQGQEWGASAPFIFFTDHDEELGAKIIEGRRSEFKGFADFDHPQALTRIPSPQAKDTFLRSKLDWSERDHEPHRGILGMVWGAIELRRRDPVLRYRPRSSLEARPHGELLVVTRHHGSELRRIVFNPTKRPQRLGDVADGTRVLFASDLRPVEGGMIPPEMTVILAR
jgi:maltooligosyltrehalose trehalohydrolase